MLSYASFSVILRWFVDVDVVNKVLHGAGRSLIEEEHVETRPEHVPMKCLDENVALTSVRKYFSFDAWTLVQQTVDILKDKGRWCCAVCSDDLETSSSICCDSCCDWVHLKCVNKKVPPKTKFWFCNACYAAAV